MVEITDTASAKIAELLNEEEEGTNYALRLQVVGGGCSGFQYRLAFDDDLADDDEINEVNGVKLVVDPMSMRYIEGAKVDYVETELGAGFKIDNPNVVTTCGCGQSFQA